MKRFICLLILISLAGFCISCSDNPKIKEMDEPIARHEVKYSVINAENSSENVNLRFSDDKPKYLVLSGFRDHEKNQYLQIIDVTDPGAPEIEKVHIFTTNDKYLAPENMSFAGIYDNYICIQTDWIDWAHKGKENPEKDDRYDSHGYKYQHSLSLFNMNYFTKPLDTTNFEKRKGTAFYTIGNHIFIGGFGHVSLATIENGKITVEEIYKFEPVWVHKSIDVFVRVKNKLLAIDDVCHPFYGFVFDIEDVSKPKYVKTLRLPDATNTSYQDAVCKGETIYALTKHGVRSGEGQKIFSFNLEKSECEIKDMYYGSIGRDFRNPDVEQIHGDFIPYLNDMHIFGDRFFFAGMGGIVSLPINTENAECVVHKFKWSIESIAIVENVVFALMRKTDGNADIVSAPTRLLTLKYDEQKKRFVIVNSVEVDRRVNQVHTN